jgi:hypothetical protein
MGNGSVLSQWNFAIVQGFGPSWNSVIDSGIEKIETPPSSGGASVRIFPEIIRIHIDISVIFEENDSYSIEILGGNHGQEGAVGAHDGYCICSRFCK